MKIYKKNKTQNKRNKTKKRPFFMSPARTQRARAPAHASTQHYGNTQTSTESQT